MVAPIILMNVCVCVRACVCTCVYVCVRVCVCVLPKGNVYTNGTLSVINLVYGYIVQWYSCMPTLVYRVGQCFNTVQS